MKAKQTSDSPSLLAKHYKIALAGQNAEIESLKALARKYEGMIEGLENEKARLTQQLDNAWAEIKRLTQPAAPAQPAQPTAAAAAETVRTCIFCGSTEFVHRWSSERGDYLVCADCSTISHAPFPYHKYGGSK